MSTDVQDDALADDVGEARMEDTRRGRVGVSVFIAVVLALVFAAVMPDSVIKADLLAAGQPVLNAAGLDQSWGVFAPNPPRETNRVFARVDRADGTTVFRGIPYTGGISEYWNYRWSKYGEQLQRDDRQPERVAFSRWAADQARASGARPVRVTLIRRVTPLAGPGPMPDSGPTRDVPFFTLELSR